MDPETATELAWQANVDAVQRAKTRVREILVELTRVQTWAGHQARRRLRDLGRTEEQPLVSDEERREIAEVTARLNLAARKLGEARAQFKDGVTPEQVAELEQVGTNGGPGLLPAEPTGA